MRPVEFGETLAPGTRLTLFSDDKPACFFRVIKFWMDETSGIALALKTGVPSYQVEDEEGRIHLYENSRGEHRASQASASPSLDAPERQFVDFGALGTPFDLDWDCTLGVVALTTDCESRAKLGVKNGDHLPGKVSKKLVIGLIAVCRQST